MAKTVVAPKVIFSDIEMVELSDASLVGSSEGCEVAWTVFLTVVRWADGRVYSLVDRKDSLWAQKVPGMVAR